MEGIRFRGHPAFWLSAVAAMLLLAVAAPQASAGIAEFPLATPNAGPTGIVTGLDGNLWVAETDADRIARVTPAGVVTEFTLPAGRRPVDLAVLSGLVYFTERAGDRIGRLDPSAGSDGAIQASVAEFAVPGALSAPTALAAGPDGNVWFTENGSDQLGRITPVGTITEFAVGAGSKPYGIAAGSDGALWFTEAGSSEIGRITTAGTITNEFAVPGIEGGATNLGPITSGPDGALWYVAFGTDQIGRITTAGTQSRFPAPAGSGLQDINGGPDGALWFTEGRAGKIGRMTTAGAVSEYTLPTAGGGPSGITTGPDGALWFAEHVAANVGSITADTTADALPTGPQGPPGAPGAPGAEAKLVLVAFAVKPDRPRAGNRLKVRFAITDAARVSLAVQRLGRSSRAAAQTVATKDVAAAGIGKLKWSGKLRGKKAKPGRYRLIVTAQRDGESVTSSLRARLRRSP